MNSTLQWLVNGLICSIDEFFPFLCSLVEISQMPAGWRFGKGEKPSLESIEIARKVYDYALEKHGISEAEACPLVDGGIEVDLYANNVHIELYFRAGKQLTCVILEDDSVVLFEEENLPWEDVFGVIDKFGDIVCNSSAYSTSESTKHVSGVSVLVPFITPQGEESPCFVQVAPLTFLGHTVDTLKDSIMTLRAIHPSYGNLTEPYFRQGTA